MYHICPNRGQAQIDTYKIQYVRTVFAEGKSNLGISHTMVLNSIISSAIMNYSVDT